LLGRLPEFDISGNIRKSPILGIPRRLAEGTHTSEGVQKSVTVSKTKSGRYFISVPCELDLEVSVNNDPAVGIDLGLSSFAILSNGERIENPRCFRTSEKKPAKAHRQLARKQKGSANRAKARTTVARVYEHTANQRKDFLHAAELDRELNGSVTILAQAAAGAAESNACGDSVRPTGPLTQWAVVFEPGSSALALGSSPLSI